MKKGVDERGMECYIKTVAPMRVARNSKGPCRLMRCRMYPENYTMQNKLEETLTARCNIVDVSQRNNNSFTRMKY